MQTLTSRYLAPLGAALVLLSACADAPTTATTNHTDATPEASITATEAWRSWSVLRDLALLGRTVAPFHRYDNAKAAGWSDRITACMVDQTVNGGMGFHFANQGLIDGRVQVDRPELLLYEPQENGSLRFVAVEYIIPYTFRARDAEAPVLFGQKFTRNDRFQLWGLHVWVGMHNPAGLFASWNPRVTCRFTTDVDVSMMVH